MQACMYTLCSNAPRPSWLIFRQTIGSIDRVTVPILYNDRIKEMPLTCTNIKIQQIPSGYLFFPAIVLTSQDFVPRLSKIWKLWTSAAETRLKKGPLKLHLWGFTDPIDLCTYPISFFENLAIVGPYLLGTITIISIFYVQWL